jgi:hypothetical protein
VEIAPHNDRPRENVTANIIFNLAQLGIPIRDAEFFDIQTYLDIVKLQKEIFSGETNRQASQADINAFLG